MPRWTIGEADIEELLATRQLQKVSGQAASGEHLIERAYKTLESAEAIRQSDPNTAYVLAYDATRYALSSLLAQQGLRATSAGGHYAVELAVRAQFGAGFKSFGVLRRRRNELEYPELPGDETSDDEAGEAIGTAQGLVDAASRLLPQLGLF